MAKTLAEKIAVMQAAERGEEIQSLYNYGLAWEDNANPNWNWFDFDFRVKPKPQKFWVIFDTKGNVISSGTYDPSMIMRNTDWKLEWYERTPR